MNYVCLKRFTPAFIIFSIFILFGGCATIDGMVSTGPNHPVAKKNGPPAHAPAHGYRAKYQYRYYPACSVYFDVGRKLYFYLEGDQWRISAELPNRLRVGLGDYVFLEMDSDRPYLDNKNHQQKYPPGQIKKNKTAKWIK
ncbi:MAG: hypothetical protein P8X68_22630 [Desulfobacterales bacterium]|jgi:hypothetical protein